MTVKALKKLLYKGQIYEEGAIFEMDEVTAGISEKYGNITSKIEEPAGLPPLELPKKKK